ncbi:DUF3870 domain-containing protein [Alkalihalobacillus sp. BA299]|uniref:DUF3870 domain-containing protein n=1 Tax=Alkalihalobacillus sp. BA299 TaxID=2815938 RepID=UPI001ADB6B70|nr:DUF3870 domain-containing protein [Alkalihalobacillus sp. BA299]
MDTKEISKKTVLVVGRSKLPEGVAVKKTFDHFALVAIVDSTYGVIVKIDTTLATEVAREYLVELLLGCSLLNGEELEERINDFYFGGAKNSIIAAIKDLCRKFSQLQEK